MTLSLAIALIVIADVALVGALAYVMSRASRLEPHVATLDLQAAESPGPARRARVRPRASRVPASAASR
jgi:hypothetical protein